MRSLDRYQRAHNRLGGKLGLHFRQVQIGSSPAAVIAGPPKCDDMSADEVGAIAGVAVGESQGPAYGYNVQCPPSVLRDAIAAGAAESGDTTFYQYAKVTGACLGNIPTQSNPGQGGEWFITEEDGVTRPFYVNWPAVELNAHNALVPLIGNLTERLHNANIVIKRPSTWTDNARGIPETVATDVACTAYLQQLAPSPTDRATGRIFEEVDVEGRLLSPTSLDFEPAPEQLCQCSINGIPGTLRLNPTITDYAWTPCPPLGQRISGMFTVRYRPGDAI